MSYCETARLTTPTQDRKSVHFQIVNEIYVVAKIRRNAELFGDEVPHNGSYALRRQIVSGRAKQLRVVGNQIVS